MGGGGGTQTLRGTRGGPSRGGWETVIKCSVHQRKKTGGGGEERQVGTGGRKGVFTSGYNCKKKGVVLR